MEPRIRDAIVQVQMLDNLFLVSISTPSMLRSNAPLDMHISIHSTIILLPLFARAANVVLSNDDGWAEKNIRVFYDALTAAGENVLISAPADNRSGTGSSDEAPEVVTGGCEFSSCPAGSPAIGTNGTMPRFNYVNSYPVTSIRYGIQNLSRTIFGGPPDIAVAGYNVGGTFALIVFL